MENNDLEKVLQQVRDEQENRLLVSYIGSYDKFQALSEKELEQLKNFVKMDKYVSKKHAGELTPDELKFMYGLFKITDYFDYIQFSANLSKIKQFHNKVFKQIIETRPIAEDLSKIYGCLPEEIGFNYYDLLDGKCKIFYGNLNLEYFKKATVAYNLLIKNRETMLTTNNKDLERIVEIILFPEMPIGNPNICKQFHNGLIEMMNSDDSKEFEQYLNSLLNLEIVIGDIHIDDKSDSFGLNNLKEVWGDITSKEICPPSLNNLKIVDGSLYFFNVTDVKNGLEQLNYVGGKLYIYGLKDTSGLANLNIICDSLSLSYDCNLKGLSSLKYVYSPKDISKKIQSKEKRKLSLTSLKQNLIAFFHKEDMQPQYQEKVK